MPTLQMAPGDSGIGGLLQGAFGTYPPASDGTYTVDTRDATALLARGMSYVRQNASNYNLPMAPAAATIAAIVASGALSNGTVAVAANPDVMRPVNVEVGTGTTAITAGTMTVTYVGNDGVSASEVVSLACALSSSVTTPLSRGVVSITSITVAGLVGGTSPWRRLSTTAGLSVPVAKNAVDVTFIREYDAGATIAVGTAVASVLGSITPTTAPNGTVTYSFGYSFASPVT